MTRAAINCARGKRGFVSPLLILISPSCTPFFHAPTSPPLPTTTSPWPELERKWS